MPLMKVLTEYKRRRLDAAIDDSLEDYTPSEPAEPFDEVDTHRYSSFPAAAPAASTASEPTEHPAARELSPPVPEHLDEMSDQPEPSTTPMNLDPVTSEAYRTPVALAGRNFFGRGCT